ncbi:MAG: hypothetical protein OHK0046_23990 [Anaerolineae bacterium]
MIRILYCVDYLVAGGVERQTTALITGLDRSRFQPEVICLYGERLGASLHFAPLLREHDVPLHLLDLTHDPVSKWRAFQSMISHSWRFRPHLFHTVNYHGNILSGATHFLMPAGTHRIVSVRAENTPKQIRNQLLSWRLAKAIIANSPHLVEQLVNEAGLPMTKITHIPNGINTSRFDSPVDPAFREQLAPGAKHVILMVVRISARKVPQMLVQALGLLKMRDQLPEGTRVVIVGEVEDLTTQSQLEATINQYSLHDAIIQHPQVDNITPYYQASDFSVLVSLWGEGLPNVVLESLAAGRPAVVSEAANRVGLVDGEKTGWLVRTGDVEHLAQTLLRVLRMPTEEMKTMSAACQRKAAEYSMDQMIARHVAVYEEALQHG